MTSIHFFSATSGGRTVVEAFLKKDIKNDRELQTALVAHLQTIEQSSIQTLRETQRIEHITESIYSYRFRVTKGGTRWVRLLLAFWPNDTEITILHLLVKKTNTLTKHDKDQAKTKFRNLQSRRR